MKVILMCILSFCVGGTLFSQSFDYSVIGGIEHPRLLLKPSDEKSFLKCIEEYPELQKINQRIIQHCDQLLIKPPQYYHKEGRRLTVGYTSADYLFYLSYAYRITKDRKYSIRAEQEIRALCGFPDWNPSHFLDTGTIVMALAIAYDWLFSELSKETKELVCESIVEKGFKPSKTPPGNWFYTLDTNWNSVCNAGLVYGALAIFNEREEFSKEIIEKCMQTIHKPLHSYEPDGAYPEGYGYWQYGTGQQVLLNAAFESVFGTDNGLSVSPGFFQSAYYMLHMVGPSRYCFNYSDCPNVKPECVFPMFWFAKKLNDTSLLWWEKQRLLDTPVSLTRYLPLFLTFVTNIDWKDIKTPDSKVWVGNGLTPVVLVRTNWNQENAIFFGAKGGTPGHSHAHMDAGSFVFDAQGVRWAMDLGMQNYESLEKYKVDLFNPAQDAQRWEILRMNNWHHNTLTINDQRHNVNGHAKIINTFDKKNQKGASFDLSEMFQGTLRKAIRSFLLKDEKYLEITDYLVAESKSDLIQWTMCTPSSAKILKENSIELSQDGKILHLIVDTPKNVKMQIWSNEPEHYYDERNDGTLRVGFTFTLASKEKTQIKVRLVPQM